MDLFPDFDELGIWGYIVPMIVLLAVTLPIWRLSGRASNSSLPSRIFRTVCISAVVLVVLCILLILIGGIVFSISNPSLL